MSNEMSWVEEIEKQKGEEYEKSYFKINEGQNLFQLLTPCAPFYIKWTGAKYVPAQKGDKDVAVKGVCYVLQDEVIKEATLAYTVIKQIKAIIDDPDWDIVFPCEHYI